MLHASQCVKWHDKQHVLGENINNNNKFATLKCVKENAQPKQ